MQSVAVRILVQRELERIAFHSGTYWDLKASLSTSADARFDAQLVSVGGKRVAAGRDFDESTGKLKTDADVLLIGEEQAQQLRDRIQQQPWTIASVETPTVVQRQAAGSPPVL